jgi:hypothetical protein
VAGTEGAQATMNHQPRVALMHVPIVTGYRSAAAAV